MSHIKIVVTNEVTCRMQACWNGTNIRYGAFLHSPLFEELKAVEAMIAQGGGDERTASVPAGQQAVLRGAAPEMKVESMTDAACAGLCRPRPLHGCCSLCSLLALAGMGMCCVIVQSCPAAPGVELAATAFLP